MSYYSWLRNTLIAFSLTPNGSENLRGQNLTIGSATVISSRLKVNGGGSAMR